MTFVTVYITADPSIAPVPRVAPDWACRALELGIPKEGVPPCDIGVLAGLCSCKSVSMGTYPASLSSGCVTFCGPYTISGG